MNCGSRDHCQDSEVETRPRAPSRARQYLEQIRSCVTVSVSDVQKWDYLVDAAKQIRLALEHDVGENYEEAFNFYKNGVDLLLSGLQVDCNTERREAVKLKISQYLKRAEEIFNCHLQKNLGNGPDAVDGYNSLRFRPVRILCSAVENLKPCKVLRIIDKVQLVQDPCTGATFILKSLPKSQLERRKQQTIIPQGVPFMVTLLCYYTSEDAVILQLEHVEGGKLWSQLQKQIPTNIDGTKEHPECRNPLWKTIQLKDKCITAPMSLHCELSDPCYSQPSEKHTQLGNCRNNSSQLSWKSSPDFSTVSCDVHGCGVHCRFYTTLMGGMIHSNQAQDTEFNVTHVASFSDSSALMNQRKCAQDNDSKDWESANFQTDGKSSSNLREVSMHQNLPDQSLIRGFLLKGRDQNGIPSGPIAMPAWGEGLKNITVKVGKREVPYALGLTLLGTEKTSAKASGNYTSLLAHSLSSAALPTRETTAPVPWTRWTGFGNMRSHYPVPSSRTVLAAKGGGIEKTTQCQDGDIPVPAVQSLGYYSHHPCKAKAILSRSKVGSVLDQSMHSTDRHAEMDCCCLVTSVNHEMAQGAWGLPEQQIKQWAAEIVLALEGLHQQGVTCYDLNPRNILLDTKGHIRLTYFGQWTEVEPQYCSQALENLYAAPEILGVSTVTQACDWWSLGALLYELLTGMSLSQNHRSGIHPHTGLLLPDSLSSAASSLLSELLQYDPDHRLGSGVDGISKIKAHPFFSTIKWNKLL
ncbi:ribosomal protein S6 kinase-like 1 isoform X1 [Microcaecilia unicolor]|uniref:Ribosomal protein S6 kinase-like 1 isoform X1 n=1 Tax=Microcaecilia unicolor TaxID=1415580 RepID=A0A6P7YVP1_9AMPH|nr:ribosomal protein S6 kinase-like 1 isoform X1 [Microcaecilia unicolor]XP_030071203.1 ribosomal protein S6 kinase-like 1 isoform X1 [Microcaecilia unicolor]XP_030071204.1 ribosomal protein S6 kinase-like 1 isoform X1 [Microcaecilia unicolor]XP_030071205.1 ribosomal protein S6 kinase-like 1 isoform X1 [Microcaecilia unicolor]XP_030071206.1 ribosomal protein S6 kinase-like 1 isoform X1 [Microcaecilia unicolor]